jgi:hypothetical protein
MGSVVSPELARTITPRRRFEILEIVILGDARQGQFWPPRLQSRLAYFLHLIGLNAQFTA